MSRDATDRQLFKSIKQGDEVAFELLFKSYYAQLCQVANSLINNKMIAEEIVSDVFFSIWEKRETITIQTNVSGYLFKATRNHALNNLKTSDSKNIKIEDICTSILDLEQIPSEKMISTEALEQWENKIKQLPPKRQKVLVMNKLEGLSYSEIANKLSLSPKTVRNQVQIAIRSLKFLLCFLLSH